MLVLLLLLHILHLAVGIPSDVYPTFPKQDKTYEILIHIYMDIDGVALNGTLD